MSHAIDDGGPRSDNPAGSPTWPLRVMRRGAVSVATLDRPAALNAVTIAMRQQWLAAVPPLARDAECYASIIRAAPAGRPQAPVFSAGGDIREMAALAGRDPAAAAAVLAEEHRLCWVVECFSKPTVSLIDGLVVGLTAGVTRVGTHRVAGSSYHFSMPETRIGFIPNVGVVHALARMPDSIGMYIGLTGRRIGRADALALGLVTHCIDAAHYQDIEAALAEARPVDPLLDGLHVDPGPPALAPHRDMIADCFGQPTVEAIVAGLRAVAAGTGAPAEFAASVLDDLRRASPVALKVTLRHIREAAQLDLRQVLIRDSRLAARCFEHGDFRAGVAAVFDRSGGRAAFQPSRLEDVSPAMVERYFVARDQTEFLLPTRAEMQAARS